MSEYIHLSGARMLVTNDAVVLGPPSRDDSRVGLGYGHDDRATTSAVGRAVRTLP